MEQEIIEGKKLYMSQIFGSDGKVVPVTIVEAESAEALAKSDNLVNRKVLVTGTSKGKGFTGVIKRWGFRRQDVTRGSSDKVRASGAIGSQTPGRVFKGKKMAGRKGNRKVTVKGLKIVCVEPGKKELMISGPIPGARNSKVKIRII